VSEVVKIPDWISIEVTGDFRYSNSFLAANPFHTWK
jgi:CYTH domain-containing protein